jgi:hypothetical protein
MQADEVGTAINIVGIVLLCSTIAMLLFCLNRTSNEMFYKHLMNDPEDVYKSKTKSYYRTVRKMSIYTIVMVLFTAFIPSTKTLITVFAVPTLAQVADDVQLDETAKKSVEAVNKLLDAYIEDNTK